MSHDPMCPWSGLGDYWADVCEDCHLIARVREDEHRQMVDRQVASAITDKDTHGALSRHIYEKGYAAALRDAVEAVMLSCSADIELVERSEVIAAIEALGGER